MAITTLAELRTAVAARYPQASYTTAQIDEGIAIAEARMQRQLRALDMETKSATFSLTAEYTAQPNDFIAVRDFYVNTTPPQQLRLVAPEYITDHYGGSTGTPCVYAVVGSNFRFGPAPSTATSSTS